MSQFKRRRLVTVASIHRARVREQPLAELMALIGIAIGVALLYAVQVSSSSVTGVVEKLSAGLTGSADHEIVARGVEGIDQSTVERVRSLKGVRSAAPVVEQRVSVYGPRGEQSLSLIGLDKSISELEPPLLRDLVGERGDLRDIGLHLTTESAQRIDASAGDRIRVATGSTESSLVVAGLLGRDRIGDLVHQPVAIAPLATVQRLGGIDRRISRIYVDAEPGVRSELQRVAGVGVDVRDTGSEAQLIAAAMRPDQVSSSLFSAVSVVIGLLFALNAMLLAADQRRRHTSTMRLIGADRGLIFSAAAYDAIVLGLIASVLGIAAGEMLSRVAFSAVPEYLVSGFPIGQQRVVDPMTLGFALAGGLLAAAVASIKPTVDAIRAPVTFGIAEQQSLGARTRFGSIRGAVAFASVLGVVLALTSASMTPVGVLAAVGLLLVLTPSIHGIAVREFTAVTRHRGSPGLSLAADELLASRSRGVAVALIAGAAILAIVSVDGAKQDLERGIDRLTGDYFRASDIWIAPTGRDNVFVTRSFAPGKLVGVAAAVDGVAAIGRCSWTFLDVAQRRVLVVSPAEQSRMTLVPNQVIDGDVVTASRRIAQGGWIALSRSLAKELGNGVGEIVRLPTPTGYALFKLAAVTANHGWPSGSIVIGERDYAKYWDTERISAISVNLKSGADIDAVRRELEAAIGSGSALEVQTGDEMLSVRAEAFAQGLTRLRQITFMVLIASVLAVTAAVFAAIWQGRRRLRWLWAIGLRQNELRRMLLVETLVVIAVGCVVGAAVGLIGQFFASRWITVITGYMTEYQTATALGLTTSLIFIGLAALVASVPAFLVTRSTVRGAAEGE